MLRSKTPEPRIELHLEAGRCIECAARAKSREITERLLADEPTEYLADSARQALLIEFLLETDFDELRKKTPLLDGQSGVSVIIEKGFFGKTKIKAVKRDELAKPEGLLTTIKEKQT